MARRKLWYVWWQMSYIKPNTYANPTGAAIIVATSREEAEELGRPSAMAAGNVWAQELTVDFVEPFGRLEIKP